MRYGRFACRSSRESQLRITNRLQEISRGYSNYHQLQSLDRRKGEPKWQRWATFHRLEYRFDRADERANHSQLKVIQRLQAGRCDTRTNRIALVEIEDLRRRLIP